MKKYNQFKALLSITRASTIAMLKNPLYLIVGLLVPLTLTVVLGMQGSFAPKYDIYITGDEYVSSTFYQKVVENSRLRILHDWEESNLDKDIKKGEIEAIVTVSRDGNNADISINRTSRYAQETKRILENEFKDNSCLDKIPNITMEEIGKHEFKEIDYILPRQLAASILNVGVFTTAFILVNLRDKLVLKRIVVTPIKRIYIIAGEALSRLVLILMQGFTVILLGYFLLDFTLYYGWLTFFYLLIVCILGSLIFLGLGFAVSGLSSGDTPVGMIVSIVTIPQMLLSGMFIELDAFPDTLIGLSKLLPLTILGDTLFDMSFHGYHLHEMFGEIFALCIWGIFIYVVAVKSFKWE